MTTTLDDLDFLQDAAGKAIANSTSPRATEECLQDLHRGWSDLPAPYDDLARSLQQYYSNTLARAPKRIADFASQDKAVVVLYQIGKTAQTLAALLRAAGNPTDCTLHPDVVIRERNAQDMQQIFAIGEWTAMKFRQAGIPMDPMTIADYDKLFTTSTTHHVTFSVKDKHMHPTGFACASRRRFSSNTPTEECIGNHRVRLVKSVGMDELQVTRLGVSHRGPHPIHKITALCHELLDDANLMELALSLHLR